jgi:hypothetical protein
MTMENLLTLLLAKNNSGQVVDFEAKSKPFGIFFIMEINSRNRNR